MCVWTCCHTRSLVIACGRTDAVSFQIRCQARSLQTLLLTLLQPSLTDLLFPLVGDLLVSGQQYLITIL